MNNPDFVPKTPMKSIGARDIIKLDYEKCGHLRKEGLIERSFIGKFVPWRQYFVVVRDGCCYVFDSDQSTQPKTAFSFENYCRLECFAKTSGYDYCFKIIPRASCDDTKEQSFAASDDIGRREWLIAIYKALHVANNLPEPQDVSKHVWNEDIFGKSTRSGSDYKGDNQQSRRKYSKMPSKSSSSPMSSDDFYYEISGDVDISLETNDDVNNQSTDAKPHRKESFVNKRIAPPSPTSKEENGAGGTQQDRSYMNQNLKKEIEEVSKRILTSRSTKDKSGANTPQQDTTYMNLHVKKEIEDVPLFQGNALEAKSIINGQPVGTFLIRTSKQDVNNFPYVLVVSSPTKEKQFRIFKQENGEINITTGVYFTSLSELVDHYRKNVLSEASGIKLTKHLGNDGI